MPEVTQKECNRSTVIVQSGGVELEANLCIPEGATGIVVFVLGSGSSRCSPRNQYVAAALNAAGMATLLFDLLTPREEHLDSWNGQFRFDVHLLARRVVDTTRWLKQQPDTAMLNVGYFGASTGAAAALVAAAKLPDVVIAVVSRSGRADLAASSLAHVIAPTLLIVGEKDRVAVELNRQAMKRMTAATKKSLSCVSGATHLFDQPGTLEAVAELTREWFGAYL